MITFHRGLVFQALQALLTVVIATAPLACRNPAQSSLPSTALTPSNTPFPALPKGDVYADETVANPDTRIEEGDTLEVLIRRGAGEEKFTSVVRESGKVTLSFVEVEVGGVTAAQAEARIQEKMAPYMRDPRVQVQLKKKALRVKRVFVFGDVKKPGMYPLSRNMTVLQAVALADNYNETALLEEIRVIRGSLVHPDIYTADLARLYTYGDFTRNLALEENDVIFIPREHLGDGMEAAKKLMPIVQVAITPFYPAFIIPAFFPGAVLK
ncbi:MAG: polysaccharide biosynthesis/export family protein [Nitrospiraceae bacterium]